MKFFTFLIALFSVISCQKTEPIINSPGLIEGNFLTFKNAEKTKMLNSGNIKFIVTSDNNKVYTFQSNKIGIYTDLKSNTFFQLFNGFSLTKDILKEGLNTIEMVYSNGNVDKISLDVSFTTVVNYNKVVFNGKEIALEKRDSPAKKSFVYTLD